MGFDFNRIESSDGPRLILDRSNQANVFCGMCTARRCDSVARSMRSTFLHTRYDFVRKQKVAVGHLSCSFFRSFISMLCGAHIELGHVSYVRLRAPTKTLRMRHCAHNRTIGEHGLFPAWIERVKVINLHYNTGTDSCCPFQAQQKKTEKSLSTTTSAFVGFTKTAAL